jgi:hypothetical protein
MSIFKIKPLLSLLLSSLLLSCALGHGLNYTIAATAPPLFAKQDALAYTINLLENHPEIKQRLLEPTHLALGEDWAYHSQTYGSESTMLHLVALQIKAMAERNAIQSTEDVLDPEFGIGSKNHKDKGTINNPLSWFGHPVQQEILITNSKLKTLKVYHAFRRTIKNDLIHFARNQSLEWHQQNVDIKLKSTLYFLRTQHPHKTLKLRKQLKKHQLDLELLLRKALSSHLLSEFIQPAKKSYRA